MTSLVSPQVDGTSGMTGKLVDVADKKSKAIPMRPLVLKRSINRLPWLDGGSSSRNMPGGYDTELTDFSNNSGSRTSNSAGYLSPAPLDTSSGPRHHISTSSLPEVPGSFASRNGDYTPSTYSSTRRQDNETESQHSLAKKDAASYEKLVDKPFEIESRAGFPVIPPRLSSLDSDMIQSKIDVAPALSEDGDIGLSAIPRSRSFDGNLSSDAPSRRRHTHHAYNTTPRAQGAPTMQDTMSNLRGLMTEAMRVAEEAEKHNRADDMSTIFREASLAMRNASQVSGKMKSPLQLSDIDLSPTSEEYSADSSSDLETDSSPWGSPSKKALSDETVPTEYSTSLQSVQSPRVSSPVVSLPINKPVTAPGQLMVPKTATSVSDSDISPTTIPEEAERYQLGLPLGLQRLHQPPSADSIVIDFAYMEHQPHLASAGKPVTAGHHSHRRSKFSHRHRSGTRRKEHFQEDVDLRPEDVEQAPIRSHTSEEPIPRLRHVPPDPIPEPRTTVSSGPKRRKPRQRSLLQSPYHDVQEPEFLPEGRRPLSKRQTITVPITLAAGTDPVHLASNSVEPGTTLGTEYSTSVGSNRLKYKRRPIAREWENLRKRITAIVACTNTALIGLIAGIYAGEVPKIQYQLADMNHRVILGNVFFYLGLGISTLIAWPLPLLHGRKPYILVALALTLPLQFPQAISVSQFRNPGRRYGLILGFANVNYLATLLDLYGASLQSNHPHQEIVDFDDIRRQGGGLGRWLGLWSWCFVGSLAVGFAIGAGVTARLAPAWGFYIVIILLAVYLLINIVAPETRRAPHRRSILHYFDEEDNLQRKIARGEVKLHLAQDGPKYWWEEVWAGMRLMLYMVSQVGFAVLALYLAWIYALVVLVVLLLGALLSTNYAWRPQYVGLGVFALAVGSLLAVPFTKANLLSRDRTEPARTDSMTFQPRVTWSSHLVRRCIFTFALPIAGLAFTLSSPGPGINWAVPTVMSATVGFLATLAIAECVGLTMETYDTCDLQPGINTKHRLQSIESQVRRRRTNYSSFPRVIAGLFASQGLGFFLAAAATGVSGRITRALGAQAATAVVAGILLFLTILLSLVLWRFRTVQVIPNHAFGTKKGSKDWTADDDDKFWKPVIVGNPSGKVRRMNLLETGKWSRWTEVRRLNKLVKPGTWEVQFGK
ncbi:hypothetical protein C1H76_3450 [Elsinoe australis]|uniref:Uncharacterized protein n=1 Tax=Elsinoe australis TaxID=40998 RepID=A0A4U7B3S8_9PEZI|nr:hypothetical protein C1H76_3450 [Elsinoe australis]